MKVRRVRISDIPPERRKQFRSTKKSRDLIESLRAAFECGQNLPPPVDVFFDGEHYWLADGNHRVAAAEAERFSDIAAAVHDGGEDEATMFAAQANQRHGLRRTREDKRLAIEAVLRLRTGWADHRIAEHVGVNDKTVRTCRERLESTSEIPKLEMLEGADGKNRPRHQKKREPAPDPAPKAEQAGAQGEESPDSDGDTDAHIPTGAADGGVPDRNEGQGCDDDTPFDEPFDSVVAAMELMGVIELTLIEWPKDADLTPAIETLQQTAARWQLVAEKRKAAN